MLLCQTFSHSVSHILCNPYFFFYNNEKTSETIVVMHNIERFIFNC